MIELLGYVGHVRREVYRVAAAAELVYVVVFGRQFGVGRGLVVSAESRRLGLQPRDVAVTVAVAVVGVAVLDHAEEIYSGAAVVRYERSVERGVVFGRAALQYVGDVRQRERVAQRLLGYDVHHAAYGTRPEEGRASAADDLHTLDHGCGQLLEAVDGGQGAEYGVRVEQYLRILSFESVYAQLCGAAVAAVVLYAQPRLELHRLRKVGRGRAVEEFGRGDVDDNCRGAFVGDVARGRHYDLVHGERLLLHDEIKLDGLVAFHYNLLLDRRVTYGFGDNGAWAFGQILQIVVSRGVGRGAYGCTLDRYCHIGYMLLTVERYDVPVDIGIRGLGLCRCL